jgi:hypothetical protein
MPPQPVELEHLALPIDEAMIADEMADGRLADRERGRFIGRIAGMS